MKDPELVTVEEAAKFLKVHHETLRKWLRQGTVRGVKIGGGRMWRIPKAELVKLQQQDSGTT